LLIMSLMMCINTGVALLRKKPKQAEFHGKFDILFNNVLFLITFV
jgi:hypothetical protein